MGTSRINCTHLELGEFEQFQLTTHPQKKKEKSQGEKQESQDRDEMKNDRLSNIGK